MSPSYSLQTANAGALAEFVQSIVKPLLVLPVVEIDDCITPLVVVNDTQ